jgi:hypothetical protein
LAAAQRASLLAFRFPIVAHDGRNLPITLFLQIFVLSLRCLLAKRNVKAEICKAAQSTHYSFTFASTVTERT